MAFFTIVSWLKSAGVIVENWISNLEIPIIMFIVFKST